MVKQEYKRVVSSFQEAINERGLRDWLSPRVLRKYVPLNATKWAQAIYDAVNSGMKILIDPDCDPDGYFAGLCLKSTFDRIGYGNYEVVKHVGKRHKLEESYLTSIVENGFSMVIILDSSSSDMEGIRFLCSRGIRVLIADHHDTRFVFKDYPDGCIIVNPRIDMKYRSIGYSDVSAGVVAAILCDYLLQQWFDIRSNEELYIYGYITLYSDSCNMRDHFNKDFVLQYKDFGALPSIVSLFMDKYNSFNRSFVSWRMIPRINSLLRAEEFDFAYKLFYDCNDLMINREATIDFIEQVYKDSKSLDGSIEEQGTLYERNNIVCLVLPTTHIRYRNYTGLLAQRLSQKYNKVGVCLVNVSHNSLEGSVRDSLCRDIKSIFQTICFAEGHPPAFGVEMGSSQLENALDILDSADGIYEEKTDMIVVDWDSIPRSKAEIDAEILQMATYNELSGNNLPIAYAKVTISPDFKIKQWSKVSKASYNGFEFISFSTPIVTGCTVICKPMFQGAGVQMVVEGFTNLEG